MTLDERKQVISHCEKGMLGMVELLRTQGNKYRKTIDADQMIQCIKWFCGDNKENLDDYLKKISKK